MGKIVWLASYPKSGNTWVRAFLHNYVLNSETPHSINKLVEFSVAECAASFFHAPGEILSVAQVQALRRKVHERLTRLHDDLVFVKTHNANLTLHDAPLCTPEFTAGAVYIVRDPRDVALSFAAYTGRNVDEIITLMADERAANASDGTQVFELLSSWSKHAVSWVAAPRRLLVRYEDLVSDPEKSFARVIRFLGAAGDAPDVERLRRAISFSSFETLSAQEKAEGYNAGSRQGHFFRAGRPGQWKEKLTPAQAKRIVDAHGEVMGKFGYI